MIRGGLGLGLSRFYTMMSKIAQLTLLVAVLFQDLDRKSVVKANVLLGEELRGKGLARAVVATAVDGYQVAYAIAEIDAAFNDYMVLIVDKRNGQPLPGFGW